MGQAIVCPRCCVSIMADRFKIPANLDFEGAAASESANRKEIRKVAKCNRLKYEKEYRVEAAREVRNQRMAKQSGNFYREDETKLFFCIRLIGINKLAPKPRKILQLLRLKQINNGVFMRVNAPALNMLKMVAPYVAYGSLNVKSVRELIYKRGFGKINGQRVPLDDNEIIDKALGQFNIRCIEDLIHEIYTVGPNFKQANAFLWPFKLSNPRGGWTNKRHGFNEPRGGDWGNREDLMNQLVRRM